MGNNCLAEVIKNQFVKQLVQILY